MTRVTIQDGRDLRYCVRGMQRWAKTHGFSFERFLAEGTPAEILPQDDVMIAALIERAKQREAENGRQE